VIDLLKASGYDLPPRETDYSNLTTKEIMNKIAEFMSNTNPKHEDLVFDFWHLIADYPVSICERKMSDTLTFLITLFYHYKIPKTKQKDEKHQELWDCVREKINNEGFYSYEQLAILFMRSKASIHDAIKAREGEIMRLMGEVNMRRYARSIALKELVAEEKLKLLEKSSKGNRKNKRTNVPTPSA